MKTKVLIFYTSVGLGHKFIAQNIARHLEESGFEARLEDMLEVQSGNLVDGAQKFYFWMHKTVPWFWSWLYVTRLTNLLLPLRLKVAARNCERAKKLITEYNPDIILSTEVNPSAVVAFLKRRGFYKKPFGISFSDFHIHRFWIYKEADFYLVNIKEQKQALIKLGVAASRIAIVGIPMWPKKVDPKAVREKLGIKASKVLVVSAGSLGYGVDKKYVLGLVDKIKTEYSDFVMLLVCGKFKTLYDKLKPIENENLKVFGFYSPMEELYSISDIFVGKPGGLSTTEALLWNLPIVLTHWMAGGEELNVRYLTKNRLVLPVSKMHGNRDNEIIKQIIAELKTRSFREKLALNKDLITQIANTNPEKAGDFMKGISPRV